MKDKGITLVALVVTIIVLILLAGISIHLILGENGILEKAKVAKENYIASEKKETEELNSIEQEINKIEESLIPVTEKPIIEIEDKEQWSGKEGKKVRISTQKGCITKYTIDGTNPGLHNGEEYQGEIRITDNCIIKASYIKENEQEGKITTEEITTIDKNPPIALEIAELVAGKKSMTVTVIEAKDEEASLTDAQSGIAGYCYRLNGGEWTEWTTDTTYKFDHIYGDFTGVACMVEVKTRDYAGNEIQNVVSKTSKTTCYNATYCKNINAGAVGKLNNGGTEWTTTINSPRTALMGMCYMANNVTGMFFIVSDSSGLTVTWSGTNGDYRVRGASGVGSPYPSTYSIYGMTHSNIKSITNPYGAVYLNNSSNLINGDQARQILLSRYYSE